MSTMAPQITSHMIVYSTVYWGTDERKNQSYASLAFVRWQVNSPHKRPVTRKMFPFDDVIMIMKLDELYSVFFCTFRPVIVIVTRRHNAGDRDIDRLTKYIVYNLVSTCMYIIIVLTAWWILGCKIISMGQCKEDITPVR